MSGAGASQRNWRARRDQEDAICAVLRAHAGPFGAVTLGVRRIAEETGYSKDTVARRLAGMEGTRLRCTRHSSRSGTLANTWHLIELDPSSEGGITGTGVWSKTGLGHRAERVWAVLDEDQGRSVADAANAAGLTSQQTRHQLRILQSAGLADVDPSWNGRGNHWLRLPVDEERISNLDRFLGVTEQKRQRRSHHLRQRVEWQRICQPPSTKRPA